MQVAGKWNQAGNVRKTLKKTAFSHHILIFPLVFLRLKNTRVSILIYARGGLTMVADRRTLF
jgi:hypothetical protein